MISNNQIEQIREAVNLFSDYDTKTINLKQFLTCLESINSHKNDIKFYKFIVDLAMMQAHIDGQQLILHIINYRNSIPLSQVAQLGNLFSNNERGPNPKQLRQNDFYYQLRHDYEA